MASTIPSTQRALQFSAPTPLSTFQNATSAPVPTIPSNTSSPATIVRILSTSLNPVDYKLASLPLGIPRLAIGASPMTPGTDFIGRVARTTDPTLAPGDLVFGKLDMPSVSGTCAEYTLVKGTHGIAKVPAGWAATGRKADEFAGIGVCALTALMALRKADVPYSTTQGRERGGKLFINGSSGGVGTFAIQLAKQVWGCTVVASCSGANAQLVRDLGADEVIDYRSVSVVDALEKWTAANGPLDAVLDFVGSDMTLYWQAHHYLKEKGGRYLQIGAGMDLGSMWTMAKVAMWPGVLGGGKRAWAFESLQGSTREDLEFMAKLMVEGKLRCVVDDENVFDLTEGRNAYEKLHTGRVRGKVIVKVSED